MQVHPEHLLIRNGGSRLYADTSGMCIVFRSFRVSGLASLLFAMITLFLLSVAYERMRQVVAQREMQLRNKHLSDLDARSGKRRPSNNAASAPTCECSTNERGNLLKCHCSAWPARIELNSLGCSVEVPLSEQMERSAWYTTQIAVSFFISTSGNSSLRMASIEFLSSAGHQ